MEELKLALDQHGYTEPNLRTAWREWKNDDIAADIISFIRRQALGDPLVSHEDRIRRAMKKVYGLEKWTKIQRQWLERIEKQLVAETVFEREDFDKGAFRAHGGFDRINKIFQGRLQETLDEINSAVAKLVGVDEVKYNSRDRIRKVAGEGSFQALDASYPIDQEFWPDWLKYEVDKFSRYKS